VKLVLAATLAVGAVVLLRLSLGGRLAGVASRELVCRTTQYNGLAARLFLAHEASSLEA